MACTGAVVHVIKKDIEVLNIRSEARGAATPPVRTAAVWGHCNPPNAGGSWELSTGRASSPKKERTDR